MAQRVPRGLGGDAKATGEFVRICIMTTYWDSITDSETRNDKCEQVDQHSTANLQWREVYEGEH